jgi:hypothetical protein
MMPANPTLESKSTEVPPIRYRVLRPMDLTSPSPRGKEQHLEPGDLISLRDLLLFTRKKYIDMKVACGDLEVIADADVSAR